MVWRISPGSVHALELQEVALLVHLHHLCVDYKTLNIFPALSLFFHLGQSLEVSGEALEQQPELLVLSVEVPAVEVDLALVEVQLSPLSVVLDLRDHIDGRVSLESLRVLQLLEVEDDLLRLFHCPAHHCFVRDVVGKLSGFG